MNFLENIWLIPLFPLFGAAVMLFLGRKFDPQAPSKLAVAPGVEPVADKHDHGHGLAHGTGKRIVVSLLCPGMVLEIFKNFRPGLVPGNLA